MFSDVTKPLQGILQLQIYCWILLEKSFGLISVSLTFLPCPRIKVFYGSSIHFTAHSLGRSRFICPGKGNLIDTSFDRICYGICTLFVSSNRVIRQPQFQMILSEYQSNSLKAKDVVKRFQEGIQIFRQTH